MELKYKQEGYYTGELSSFLVQYNGDILQQLNSVSYAFGNIINDKLAIVICRYEDIEKLKNDVPSIIYIDKYNVFVLEDVNPSSTAGIPQVIKNPYLDLSGKNIIVGLLDTGIDYLNEDFMFEDGKTKILTIWDQGIEGKSGENVSKFNFGDVYNSDDINNAIIAKQKGEDPYKIVESKDLNGHGTKIAGIIGGKGYSKKYTGIAENCFFAVVKLKESMYFKKKLKENGIKEVPVYSSAEIVAGIQYLMDYAKSVEKNIVIFIGVGGTEVPHDGSDIMSRYITEQSFKRGIAIVTSTGNEGEAEGHFRGIISKDNDESIVEIKIPREIARFTMKIWIKYPDKMSINIVSPSSEQSGFVVPKIKMFDEFMFYYENTYLGVTIETSEAVTGYQLITLAFKKIKMGIWKFILRGEYISNGLFDIWLPPKITLPEGTKFLSSNSDTTLTIPSTAEKVLSVGYYNSELDSIVSSSGKGDDRSLLINPDVVAPGINILTTSVGGKIVTASGGSVAAAIASGVSVLIFDWAFNYKNDNNLNSNKLRAYIIYGAERNNNYIYPNVSLGYGKLSLEGIFNFITGISLINLSGYRELRKGSIFISIPENIKEINNDKWRNDLF